MGERITCGLIGLVAGGVGGFFTHVGLDDSQVIFVLLLVSLFLGAFIGSIITLLVGLTRVERLLSAFALLGLILGGFAGLVGSVGVIALAGILPWYVISPILGFLIGYILCWLCEHERFAKAALSPPMGQ